MRSVIKRARKEFRPPSAIFVIIFCLKFFGNFSGGFFWRNFLGEIFGRIFWGGFFGRNSSGGILTLLKSVRLFEYGRN